MSASRTLGGVLLAFPFIAVIGASLLMNGLVGTLVVLACCALMIGCVFGGVTLLGRGQ